MIEAELPDGTILEFPDGTDQAVIQKVVKQRLGVSEITPPASAETQPVSDTVMPGALNELATGAHRSIASMIDFLGPDRFNDVLRAVGFQYQVPTLSASVPQKGAYDQSTAGRIAGVVGEGLPMAAGVGGAIRGMASMLPAQTGTAGGVLRTMAASTPAQEAASTVTAGIGQEVGRDVGGDTGAIVGGIAGGVAGAALASGGKALLDSVFSKNKEMIDQATGLPVPAFEKALKKRGIDYGALIDDADNLPVIQTKKSADEVADAIIRDHLRSGKKTDFVYKYRLQGGKIVDDDLGIEAARQGFQPGDIAQAKQMNDATRRQALKMLNMQRAIKANTARSQEFRPTDVVGDAATLRIKALDDKATNLRAELNRIATKEFAPDERALPSPDSIAGKPINLDRVENTFKSLLDDLNVSYNSRPDAPPLFEQIKQKGFFDGSDIMEDRASQGVIKSVTNLMASPGRNDAWRAHKVKTQIDKMIDYKKASLRGLTPTGQKFAKAMRSALNDEIREVSPRYAQVNDQLSGIIKTFEDLQTAVGPNANIFASNADESLGRVFRTLWSKNQKRDVLKQAVDNLENTAQNMGIKFNTNIKDLSQFAVTLEDSFGDVARTGFKAEVASGVNLGMDPKMAALKYAGEKVGEQVAKFRNINDTERFNVMTKILQRGNK